MVDDALSSSGTCCLELAEALEFPGSSLQVDENGVLLLVLGALGPSGEQQHLAAALAFCPFCGRRLTEAPEPR